MIIPLLYDKVYILYKNEINIAHDFVGIITYISKGGRVIKLNNEAYFDVDRIIVYKVLNFDLGV